jgi:hypothetical protein
MAILRAVKYFIGYFTNNFFSERKGNWESQKVQLKKNKILHFKMNN